MNNDKIYNKWLKYKQEQEDKKIDLLREKQKEELKQANMNLLKEFDKIFDYENNTKNTNS